MAVARIYRAHITGTAVAVAVARIYRAHITGTTGIVLAALPNHLLTEPGSPITLTAVVVQGGPATSHTWRIVSTNDPAIMLSGGTTAVNTLISPSSMPPTNGSCVIGVIAHMAGGVNSAEVFSTITALPQLTWTRIPGGSWVGGTRY